jgi:Tol biopolymer transport system component/4-amino-4-deoxy-L-arabinose transferase-like glycosyltransferase
MMYRQWILRARGWFAAHAPDAWIALLLLLAGVGYSYNLTGWLASDDEGGYLYAAWRVSSGELPYRDFLTPQLPAFLYTGGGLFKLLGPSVLVARASTVAAALLAAFFLYLTARRLTGRWVGLLAALVFVAHEDVYAVAREFRPEAIMLLAITAGTYLLVRLDDDLDQRWAVLAGAAFGLGLLTKLFAILPLLGWLLFLAYRVIRRRITVQMAVQAGFHVFAPLILIVLAVLGVFYMLAPQLPDAILFHHLRQGADQSLWQVMAKGRAFLIAYGHRFSLLLLIAALGVARTFKDADQRLPFFACQIPTALAFLFLSRALFDRHLVYLVPALALLFALSLNTMVNWARWAILAEARWRIVRYTAGSLILALAALIAYATLQPMLAADLALARRVDQGTLPLAAYIAAQTRPDELVVSDYAGLNFYARRKTTYLAAGLSTGAADGGQITGERLIQEMQDAPVTMVLMQDYTPVRAGQLVSLRDYVSFRGYVQGAFHFVGTKERGDEYHRVYMRGAPTLRPLDVNFGGELRLIGYTVEEPAVGSGEVLRTTLAWQAIRQPAHDYQLYLHLEDAQGHLWSIRDELLVNGPPFEPTSAWMAGQRVVWGYSVRAPTGTPPGEYTLKLGLYEKSHRARRLLPMDEQGHPTGVEYSLTTVRIMPPRRDPALLWPPEIPNEPPQQLQVQGLELVGYDLDRRTLDAGRDLGIRVFWRVQQPLKADYQLRLRLPRAASDLIVPLGGTTYPTHLWAPDHIVTGWYDLHTDATAASGEYPVTLNLLDPNGQPLLATDLVLATVQIAQVQRLFTIPPMQHSMPIALEDGVTFLGYDLRDEKVTPGGSVRLTLYWQARTQPGLDYTIFIHLLDETGQLRGQVDRAPVDGTRPTAGWLPGEVIRDEYVLPVSLEAVPGQYQIEIGMYDVATMRRLNVSPEDDRILLPDCVTVDPLPTRLVPLLPARPPSPTLEPTLRPGSADTAALAPTPSPNPGPVLRQLTQGGCCTQPFWSPDSRQVLFIDQPARDAPLGIWGVDVTQRDPTPELVTRRIALYTPDMAFVVEPGQSTTVIERLADGTHWTVPAGGRPVSISPGRKRIAWQVTNENLPFERQTTQVWVANVDGTDARQVTTLNRGGFSDWISDDVLLLSTRDSLQSREQVLYTFSLTDGRSTELVRVEQLRGALLSPDGAWLVYYVALNEDTMQNDLWLVRTDGSARRKLDRSLFGAFRWRDADRLLIIPFRPQADVHELWELNVETGETRRLTDPTVTPFKIANGDWTISPDGRQVAFVESRDHNIWLLTLPD